MHLQPIWRKWSPTMLSVHENPPHRCTTVKAWDVFSGDLKLATRHSDASWACDFSGYCRLYGALSSSEKPSHYPGFSLEDYAPYSLQYPEKSGAHGALQWPVGSFKCPGNPGCALIGVHLWGGFSWTESIVGDHFHERLHTSTLEFAWIRRYRESSGYLTAVESPWAPRRALPALAGSHIPLIVILFLGGLFYRILHAAILALEFW